jgi:hypothetical protein
VLPVVTRFDIIPRYADDVAAIFTLVDWRDDRHVRRMAVFLDITGENSPRSSEKRKSPLDGDCFRKAPISVRAFLANQLRVSFCSHIPTRERRNNMAGLEDKPMKLYATDVYNIVCELISIKVIL